MRCPHFLVFSSFCFPSPFFLFLGEHNSLFSTLPSPLFYILVLSFLPFLRFLWFVVFSLVIMTDPMHLTSHDASEIELHSLLKHRHARTHTHNSAKYQSIHTMPSTRSSTCSETPCGNADLGNPSPVSLAYTWMQCVACVCMRAYACVIVCNCTPVRVCVRVRRFSCTCVCESCPCM